jgi:hypothetical protein
MSAYTSGSVNVRVESASVKGNSSRLSYNSILQLW